MAGITRATNLGKNIQKTQGSVCTPMQTDVTHSGPGRYNIAVQLVHARPPFVGQVRQDIVPTANHSGKSAGRAAARSSAPRLGRCSSHHLGNQGAPSYHSIPCVPSTSEQVEFMIRVFVDACKNGLVPGPSAHGCLPPVIGGTGTPSECKSYGP